MHPHTQKPYRDRQVSPADTVPPSVLGTLMRLIRPSCPLRPLITLRGTNTKSNMAAMRGKGHRGGSMMLFSFVSRQTDLVSSSSVLYPLPRDEDPMTDASLRSFQYRQQHTVNSNPIQCKSKQPSPHTLQQSTLKGSRVGVRLHL